MHHYIRTLINATARHSFKPRFNHTDILEIAHRALSLAGTPDFTSNICPAILTLCKKHKMTWQQMRVINGEICNSIQDQSEQFSPKEIATILYCLAALGVTNNDAIQTQKLLAQKVFENSKNFDNKEAILSLYALAQLNTLSEEILQQTCLKLSPTFNKLNNIDYVQLHTAFTYHCLNEQRKWQSIKVSLPTGALEHIIIRSQTALANGSHISKLQSQIFKILSNLKATLQFEEEQVIHCMIVDIYIPEYQTIIEVNGPYHFTQDGKLDISTLRKQALLDKLGHTLIDINYQDWDKLPDQQARQRYLAQLLFNNLGIKPTIPLTPMYTYKRLQTNSAKPEINTIPEHKPRPKRP
jgi:very-short-patch-repair endonuclease